MRSKLFEIRTAPEVFRSALAFLFAQGRGFWLNLLFLGLPVPLLQSYYMLNQASFLNEDMFFVSLVQEPALILAKEAMLALGLSILSVVALQAFVYAYLEVYQKKPYQAIAQQDVLPVFLQIIPKVLFATLFSIIALGLSFILLLIPGVLLLPAVVLVPFISVHEKRDVFSALKRAVSLTRKRWWQGFGLILIVALFRRAIELFFSMPLSFISFIENLHQLEENVAPGMFSWQFVLMLVVLALQSLLAFFASLCYAIHYFSVREFHERTALEAEVNKLGEDD